MVETEEKVKKVSVPYLLGNILIPPLLLVVGLAVAIYVSEMAAATQQLRTATAAIFGVCFILAFLWWPVSRRLAKRRRKRILQTLENSGFEPNQTFNSDGCTTVVDLVHGQVALLFRWNPGKVYVRPASALSNVYVHDGRGGAGILEGSSQVSFRFTVDGVNVKVNTFTSNRRWRMDSDYILTGISKADVMVEALVSAGARAR